MSLHKLVENLKNKNFKSCYLFYGNEPYLLRYYKKLFKSTLVENEMNFNTFSGKINDLSPVKSIAETLPFFSEHRLILIENSELFSSSNDFSKYLPCMPGSTIILFVEDKIDKRNSLYRAVNKNGLVVEFNTPGEKELCPWIIKRMAKDGIKISPELSKYFISFVGNSMDELYSESAKLISYVYEKKVVKKDDIEFICTKLLTNQIFAIMDFIGKKDVKNALNYYFDLINQQESPVKILFLINAHLKRLLDIKRLLEEGKRGEISSLLGINEYFVPKYIEQTDNFSVQSLKKALEYGVELDYSIKTGKINESMAVESIITGCFTT